MADESNVYGPAAIEAFCKGSGRAQSELKGWEIVGLTEAALAVRAKVLAECRLADEATIGVLCDAMNYTRQTLGALNEAKADLDGREHNEMPERANG